MILFTVYHLCFPRKQYARCGMEPIKHGAQNRHSAPLSWCASGRRTNMVNLYRHVRRYEWSDDCWQFALFSLIGDLGWLVIFSRLTDEPHANGLQ